MNPLNLLFFGLFFASVGQSILAPVLPPLVRELGLSEFHGGLIMSLSAVMWVITSPMWGRRSDRWGRKPVFVLGMFGYALGVGAFGLVAQLGLNGTFAGMMMLLPLGLIGARMVVGMLFSAAPPTAQAYVAEVTEGPSRTAAIAFIAAAGSVGTVLGPVIGAAVVPMGLVAPIFLSAVLAAIAGVVVALWLPRVQPRLKKGEAPPPRLRARDSRLWPYLALGVTVTTTLSAVQITAPFYFQDRLLLGAQETTQMVGLAMMGSGAATLFSQLVLVRRFQWPPLTLLRIGIPVVATAMLLMISATNFPMLALALTLQGLGMGLALPGYQSATIFAVMPQEQGSVAGLNSSMGGLGGVFGPLFGTGLYEFHMLLPYLFCLIALGLGLLLLWMHPRMRPARIPAPDAI